VTVKRSLNSPHLGMQKPLAIAGDEAQFASAPDLKEHILIVDDEKRIVQIGQEMLEHLGYRVTGHTSSMAALESVRLQPEIYDLVITDFTMPQMNGVELARELNLLRPGMPIILYTATSKVVSPENARKVGIKDYLMKPVTALELHQAIRRLLDAKLQEKRSGPKQTPEE
jgi:two-component system cell cycle sensor histidine kinase/response regulator CckA